MTLRDLLQQLGHHPQALALVLAAPMLLAVVLGFTHRKGLGGRSPQKYLYSAVVYATCLPGMAACALVGYALLFTHENLLDMNVWSSIAPIASMGVTLGMVGRNAEFKDLPGFDRLWGLMLVLGMAFMGVFILSRTSFGVFFRGSFLQLVLVWVGIFVAFQYGLKLAFRRKA